MATPPKTRMIGGRRFSLWEGVGYARKDRAKVDARKVRYAKNALVRVVRWPSYGRYYLYVRKSRD